MSCGPYNNINNTNNSSRIRVVALCDSNTCVCDAQFGFKKGGSTVDAIFTL